LDIEASFGEVTKEFKDKADVVNVSRFLNRDLMDPIK
jgi:hypothetical protein